MSPIEFAPKSLFGARYYALKRDGVDIGQIDCGGIRQPASITIGEATFRPARDGVLRATYHLDGDGARLASATPAGTGLRRFTVEAGARTFTLAVASWSGRRFTLTENGAAVGTIARSGIFSTKSQADLPDNVPLAVQAFLIWLVIIVWRRQAATNAVISGVVAFQSTQQ